MSTPSGGDDAASTTQKKPRFNLAPVQKFGRSLLLPIASLPAAALLMRLGQDDLLGPDGAGLGAMADVIGAAGNALFDHLPMLFAVGVAIGMAKKADGSTALAAVIGYFVYTGVTDAMSPVVLGAPAEGEEQELVDFHVLGGIIIGLIAAFLWQRFYRIKLPPYLAFFGGRRFVPMIVALAAIVIGVLMSFIYPLFDAGITALGEWVTENAVLGGFVYGFANRLLIPLGLHHVLNNPPWFLLGSYETADGVVHGDIERFLSGDPTAGIFMAGFFPIMMFALPAAAMAIWHEAKPAKRKLTGGVMISVALTSFLTGVTEPLEFAFMFVAWPLYVIHAFLTGTSMALVNFLEIKLGFGFSAGLFDMVLNWNIGSQPAMLILIGLGYAVLYYVVFRLVIRAWNLKTPGREDDAEETADAPEARG
ncbi:PTS transporter subunit EIIC [Nesterenkonia sp. F]|uniref:PTS transporter subunit EIIC n=1 Tax=Nesterenkonia sp. F TaxID=795955 RepID=UPI000255D18D